MIFTAFLLSICFIHGNYFWFITSDLEFMQREEMHVYWLLYFLTVDEMEWDTSEFVVASDSWELARDIMKLSAERDFLSGFPFSNPTGHGSYRTITKATQVRAKDTSTPMDSVSSRQWDGTVRQITAAPPATNKRPDQGAVLVGNFHRANLKSVGIRTFFRIILSTNLQIMCIRIFFN